MKKEENMNVHRSLGYARGTIEVAHTKAKWMRHNLATTVHRGEKNAAAAAIEGDPVDAAACAAWARMARAILPELDEIIAVLGRGLADLMDVTVTEISSSRPPSSPPTEAGGGYRSTSRAGP